MTECPVCAGSVFADHDELACRSCGRRWYPAEDEPAQATPRNLCKCGIEISYSAKRCPWCTAATRRAATNARRASKKQAPATGTRKTTPCIDCSVTIPINGPVTLRCRPCLRLDLARRKRERKPIRACLLCELPMPKGSTARYHPPCRKAHLKELHRQYQQEVREGKRAWNVRWFGHSVR